MSKVKGSDVAIHEELSGKGSDLGTQALSLSIESAEDMGTATLILTEANRLLDAVTKEKERVTKPLNEALRNERSRWKPIEETLSGAVASLRSKMSAYQTAERARVRSEEERIAARVGEGRGKIRVETAVRKIGEVAVPEPKVEASNGGSVKFRTVRKFEVIDVSLLPKECMLANETQIRKLMAAGIEVPGVRYYEEESVINSR